MQRADAHGHEAQTDMPRPISHLSPKDDRMKLLTENDSFQSTRCEIAVEVVVGQSVEVRIARV